MHCRQWDGTTARDVVQNGVALECLLTHQRLNLTVVQTNRMNQWFWNVSAPSLDFEIICSVLIKGNWTRSSGRSLRSGLGLLLLPFGEWTHSHFPNSGWWSRVPDRFLGIWDFPYLNLGIRDFTAKSVRDSELKVCAGGGMPKITFGIMGLLEILGRDYGIEKPYYGPSKSSPTNYPVSG